MLSQSMVDALNQQVNLEMQSAHVYMQLVVSCPSSLDGCATGLSQHVDEEMMQMRCCLPM